MVKFWDASAIVPLCVREAQTPLIQGVLDQDSDLVVWWVTRTEVQSALSRLVRDAILGGASRSQALARLTVFQAAWLEVPPIEDVRAGADRVLWVHPLRAADAMQLAAALVWCENHPATVGFVSLDTRLREAAQREGFTVLPERV